MPAQASTPSGTAFRRRPGPRIDRSINGPGRGTSGRRSARIPAKRNAGLRESVDEEGRLSDDWLDQNNRDDGGRRLRLTEPAADLTLALVMLRIERRVGSAGRLRSGCCFMLTVIVAGVRFASRVAAGCGMMVMAAREGVPSRSTDPEQGIGGKQRPEAVAANGRISGTAAHTCGLQSSSRPTSRVRAL
jgi:hypothetical protein